MSPVQTKKLVDLKEYGSGLASKMSAAWELARKSIGKVQKRQKDLHDQKSRSPSFSVGERVFLYKPAEKTGESPKLARPFHGPYTGCSSSTLTHPASDESTSHTRSLFWWHCDV